MFEKYITCNWQWIVPPERETIVLSSGAYRMEKEVKGRGITFEGDGLEFDKSYLISIRDAAVIVTLKGKFVSKPNVSHLSSSTASLNACLLHR